MSYPAQAEGLGKYDKNIMKLRWKKIPNDAYLWEFFKLWIWAQKKIIHNSSNSSQVRTLNL